jgi:putative CocE/NonD family hydrolase
MRLSPTFLLAALTSLPLVAQPSPTYERRPLTIPMRDGAALHAVALIPNGAPAPLPIILIRTPFGADREFGGVTPPRFLNELAKDGYIFVVQDIRGRGRSQGSFVTMRPMAAPGGTDESTDAWDTVDWLVKHLPNNGRVGVLGLSYRGWLAGMAGISPHPALKAISPQAPMVDVWMGDDFFHQGAFRQMMGVLYSGYIEGDGVTLPEGPEYETWLRFPTLDSLARGAGVDTLPSWGAFRSHPDYDDHWRTRALQNALTRSRVPTLIVGGFWDDEDLLGAQLLYRTLSRGEGGSLTHLVMGPWSHTSIVRGAGDSLGPIALGSRTAEYFHARIERPWFAHHLHGRGEGRFPRAWVYETGANAWRTPEQWPMGSAAPRKLYLQADGKLAFAPPTASGVACDPYASDPASPVPNAPKDGQANWLLDDQRFLTGRPDVVTWRSDPIAADLTITGDVEARLFASTSGTDADWVVKLIDEFPDSAGAPGYLLMVNADILRGRYWKGFDRATPIPADSVIGYTIDLHQQQYRFRKGHRLVVQVQSSWSPMYDRNPQRFVPNIFAAQADDYRSARHCVWRSARYPSHLTFSVEPGR